jgi:LPXTG-motif cell wall-anchored protein
MSRTTLRVGLAAMAVSFTAVTSTAQTTTSSAQNKEFEVVAVSATHLVVKLPEGTREITVPNDFRFTVDGRQLALGDLKPGMKGMATITTRTTVTPVVVTEVKNGEVVQATGSTLLVRTEQGFKQFTEGDVEKRGIKLVKDGVPAKFTDYRGGDRLSATIVTTYPPKVLTEQQVNATIARAAPASAGAGASAAVSRAAPSAAAAPTPAETPAARTLPKTGSAWPLLALASILSIAMGLTLAVRRRVVL